MQEVSRRTFLKGAVIAGAISSLGALTACSPKAANESAHAEEASNKGASWREAPEAIADTEISETVAFDVVVVGAGISGLSAANSAAEQGLSVAVVEKFSEGRYGGSYFGVINSRLHQQDGVDIKMTDVMTDFLRENQNSVDNVLISRWLSNSGEAMDWLLDKTEAAGLTSYLTTTDGYKRTPSATYNAHANLLDEGVYPGVRIGYNAERPDRDANDFGLACLKNAAEASGVQLYYETPASQLVKDGDKVTGVVAQRADGTYLKLNAAKGVVLASGDFIADTDMVAELLPWAVDLCKNGNGYAMVMDNAPTEALNTGDGQKMGVWAGAKMQDRGHSIMCAGGGTLTGPFLWVNSEGKRFLNENTSGGPAMASQLTIPENSTAFQIFDSKFGEDINRIGIMAFDGVIEATDEYVENIKKSATYQADTIEELAEQIGVDPTTLAETITRKNELAAAGDDVDFGVAPDRILTVEEPPFYATPSGSVAFVGLSGLVCNENLEVLTESGDVLPGLYAVGNMVGRRSANMYTTPICGATNGMALTDGYLLGKHLAEN